MKKKIVSLLLVTCFALMLNQVYGQTIGIGTVKEPPGNFLDENGNIIGLSVDFVKEIQKRVGNHDPMEILPGARLISYSLTKKNYVIFSLSRTPEREDKYHWISLVMRKPLVLFARKGANFNIKTLEDAKKVRSIGVLNKSVQHEFLLQNGFTNSEPVSKHILNLKKLMIGRISLMFHTMQGEAQLCKELNIDFDELEPVLMPQISESSIAMSKSSDPDIVKKWQDAAKAIKSDGSFNQLAQKWKKYTEDVIGVKSEIKDGALNFWRD